MSKKKNTTFKVDCEGLSQKRINELWDELSMMFLTVVKDGEYLLATSPFSKNKFKEFIALIEKYGARFTQEALA